MPLKKIYLIRHGQTRFNELGIVQGRGIDASLNDTGRQQAEMFYRAYQDVPFDKIYISSLKRTYESVAGFIAAGIPYEVHAGLDEISWGEHEGAKASPERNAYFRELVVAWNNGNTAMRIAGGESPEDVAARQKPVIEGIITAPEETVLVCMHGRAMRILLCQLLNKPLTAMDSFGHHNLGLYILVYKDNTFAVVEADSTVHLKGNDPAAPQK